jgi:hypothetical protein
MTTRAINVPVGRATVVGLATTGLLTTELTTAAMRGMPSFRLAR